MSLAEALAWTLLRSAIVTLLAGFLCHQLAGMLRDDRHLVGRRLLAVALAVLFLMPDLLVGYAYANSMLSLVHWPVLNEMLYAALVLFKVVPVGTGAVLLAPASPFSRAAAHIRVMGIPEITPWSQRLAIRVSTWIRSTGRDSLPVAALVFLLAFQEFEMASLMNATAWSVWLFDAHFRGQFLTESLRLIVWPALIALVVVAPLFLLAVSGRGAEDESAQRALPVVSQSRRWMLWFGVLLALVCLCAMPVLADGSRFGDGMKVLLRSRTQSQRLANQIGAGIAFGILSAVPAWLIVKLLLRSKSRFARWILGVLSLPGCVGSLVLSLTVLGVFQTPALRMFYDTPFPLLLALVLYLIPRCVLLHLVLFGSQSASAVHELRLLEQSAAAGQRAAAANLRWVLQGRPLFLMLAIPAWWSYFNLTAAAVLRPGNMETAPVALYNLMHYGRNAALTAQTFLAVILPLLLVGCVFVAVWFLKIRK